MRYLKTFPLFELSRQAEELWIIWITNGRQSLAGAFNRGTVEEITPFLDRADSDDDTYAISRQPLNPRMATVYFDQSAFLIRQENDEPDDYGYIEMDIPIQKFIDHAGSWIDPTSLQPVEIIAGLESIYGDSDSLDIPPIIWSPVS